MNLSFLLAGQTIWILARATGVASLVALSLQMLTGMALRPRLLGRLATNRVVSDVHTYATVLWVPFGVAHILGILLDRYAHVGVGDLIVPFLVPYGSLAIGLGTVSAQLVLVVMLAAWSRDRLTAGQWLTFHRLAYLAFATAFLHGLLSGTDLAYPWLTGVAWVVAAMLGIAGWRRITHGLTPVTANAGPSSRTTRG